METLFEPDVMTAEQFAGMWGGTSLDPERMLCVAVIEDALNLLRRSTKAKSGHANWHAERERFWFNSNSTAPFSFRWCAYQIGWDDGVIDAIRRSLDDASGASIRTVTADRRRMRVRGWAGSTATSILANRPTKKRRRRGVTTYGESVQGLAAVR